MATPSEQQLIEVKCEYYKAKTNNEKLMYEHMSKLFELEKQEKELKIKALKADLGIS